MVRAALGGAMVCLVTVLSAAASVPVHVPGPEKDPFGYDLLTYGWVLWLSLWGATVAYFQGIKNQGPSGFSFWVLFIEWLTAPAAGLSAFWLSEFFEQPRMLTAVFVFIFGYLGRNAVQLMVKRYVEKVNTVLTEEE